VIAERCAIFSCLVHIYLSKPDPSADRDIHTQNPDREKIGFSFRLSPRGKSKTFSAPQRLCMRCLFPAAVVARRSLPLANRRCVHHQQSVNFDLCCLAQGIVVLNERYPAREAHRFREVGQKRHAPFLQPRGRTLLCLYIIR